MEEIDSIVKETILFHADVNKTSGADRMVEDIVSGWYCH